MTNSKVQKMSIVKQTWLYRYPRPAIITHNKRNEFLVIVFNNDIIKNKSGIKAKCATMANI